MLNAHRIISRQTHGLIPMVLGIAAVICSPAAAAVMYSGSLTSADGGLQGTGLWVNSNGDAGWFAPTLSWTVTQNPDDSWHYFYSLSVYHGSISHWIIEASPTFTEDNLNNPLASQGSFGSIDVGLFSPGGSNPNLPAPIHGIKFDETEGLTLTISFDSLRRPVWGDTYSKDGKAGGVFNTLWNSGLTASDTDPLDHPANGSVNYHVLVPDTLDTGPVPEPATLALLATGTVALMLTRNSRRRHET
ncbi:MAG: PEP-CTERM sorting domain-containing protein [Planctomycetaceae bacterium]|nr:PEP-CTERM sorting domain-containing protein [Planctomycetaceae bacterium]